MSVDGVLGYLRRLQSESKLRERDVIHDEVQLGLELHGREAAEAVMCGKFEQRLLAFSSGVDDRMEYHMVVCSCMKGLGKTRMLEEWPRLFQRAGIGGATLGVLISYGNGHGPVDFESRMAIEATFSWRVLHRMFVEGNAATNHVFAWSNRGFLPANADEMTLELALGVVRAGAQEFGVVQPDAPLSLFIGIDEYQKVPVGPEYDGKVEDQKQERKKTYLWKLIAALDRCRRVPLLHIYLGFAGTRWGPLSIGGSSVSGMHRAPMTLLRPSAMEDVIGSSEKLRGKLVSPEFRRHLFFLGGIPRPSVFYALGRGSFDELWEEEVREKWFNQETGLSPDELIRLIAHAVGGRKIEPSANSEIKGLKWGRLFDEGLCMMLDSGQLGIPYCVFRLASGIDMYRRGLSLAAKCMIQVLQYLRRHVDDVLYDKEPWQSWETFSACFFALRVNALLLLDMTQCPFSLLCQHAIRNGCDVEVLLCPMEVHAICESLDANLKPVVTDKKHNMSLDWVQGSPSGVRYCLLNGTSGQGVDMFSALPLADSLPGALCLYNAQQKVVSASLGSAVASKLLAKADVRPLCLPAGSLCIRGLFSIMASFTQSADDLPSNSFVLSYRQHEAFHGSLAGHPACKTWVDVNFDNRSTLRLLSSVRVLAENVV